MYNDGITNNEMNYRPLDVSCHALWILSYSPSSNKTKILNMLLALRESLVVDVLYDK